MKKIRFRQKKNNSTFFLMLLRIFVVFVVSYFFASYFDFFESVERFIHKYEKYNIDEIFVVSIIITIWVVGELLYITSKLKAKSKEFEKFALIDTLTGLYNRRGFFSFTEKEFKHFDKKVKSTCVIFIDVNRFKMINDAFGHTVGDEALIRVSEYLKSIVDKNDILARIGGDEFVILTNGYNNDKYNTYIDKLNSEISFDTKKIDETINIQFSYGVAWFMKDGNTIDDLMIVADKRMYKMKNNN